MCANGERKEGDRTRLNDEREREKEGETENVREHEGGRERERSERTSRHSGNCIVMATILEKGRFTHTHTHTLT